MCVCVYAKSLQLCLTLCNPIDSSPPDSSVHGDSPGNKTGVGCCAHTHTYTHTHTHTHTHAHAYVSFWIPFLSQ